MDFLPDILSFVGDLPERLLALYGLYQLYKKSLNLLLSHDSAEFCRILHS
jgi:hypothetical protein